MSNAFDWNTGAPSVMLSTPTDKRMNTPTRRGVSFAQTATMSVARREKKDGRNPGTIAGLSPAADRQLLTPADRKGRRAR